MVKVTKRNKLALIKLLSYETDVCDFFISDVSERNCKELFKNIYFEITNLKLFIKTKHL